MRRRLAILLAAVLFAPAAAGRVAPAPSIPSPTPRLAVILVADGLSWDRLRSWRPWFKAGLARLLDEGAVETECRYDHLNTETGPGHASIATGAPPRAHGIALNQWYVPSEDGSTMEAVYCAAQPVPGGTGASAKTIPGAGRLRLPTLADRLAAARPGAKVVAVSNKDRGAILLAGRDPRQVAYWYTSKSGTYVTSAAYDASSPGGDAARRIVERFNENEAGARLAERFGTVWSRLPVPEPAPLPGFETGLASFQDPIVGPEFPHDLAKAKRPLPSALLWTPFADTLLGDLAIALLDDEALGLGRDEVPDILAVSFSANDYVSHYYGPESAEDLEVLRALDVTLGRLLQTLEGRFGREGVLVALSSDHGFLPLPEAAARHGKATAPRVHDAKIVEGLNAAVNRELGRDGGPPLVHKLEGCSLWLDRAALARPGAPSAERVLAIVRRELAGTWSNVIERSFDLEGGLPRAPGDEVARRAWKALVPGRSGDLFVVPRPGALIDPYGGTGSTHGSPWDYDTHVPLVFWGSGVKPGTRARPSTPYDLAPTLARWLKVRLPDATGKPLDLR